MQCSGTPLFRTLNGGHLSFKDTLYQNYFLNYYRVTPEMRTFVYTGNLICPVYRSPEDFSVALSPHDDGSDTDGKGNPFTDDENTLKSEDWQVLSSLSVCCYSTCTLHPVLIGTIPVY